MKPNIRVLLERFIRDGIDHTFMNTDTTDPLQLANEIDDRIWLYINEYFDFDD